MLFISAFLLDESIKNCRTRSSQIFNLELLSRLTDLSTVERRLSGCPVIRAVEK